MDKPTWIKILIIALIAVMIFSLVACDPNVMNEPAESETTSETELTLKEYLKRIN